jgi:DNA gyrase/topoisomerase IV subunit A
LIDVKLTRGSTGEGDRGDDVVLITKDGMSIRFSESDVRSMGRAAGGVRGINLEGRRGRGRRDCGDGRDPARGRRERHRQTHRL